MGVGCPTQKSLRLQPYVVQGQLPSPTLGNQLISGWRGAEAKQGCTELGTSCGWQQGQPAGLWLGLRTLSAALHQSGGRIHSCLDPALVWCNSDWDQRGLCKDGLSLWRVWNNLGGEETWQVNQEPTCVCVCAQVC